MLVVSKKFLSESPELAKKLVRAHVEMTWQLNADKKAAAEAVNAEIKSETGNALSAAVLDRAMGRGEFTWDPLPGALAKAAQEAYDAGFLKSVPKLDGLFNLSLLNGSLKELNLPEIPAPSVPR